MDINAYSALCRGYDKLNSETDYTAWADFLVAAFEKYGENINSVLDLGCGTGAMTFELHSRGYDMTAVDISPEMLSEARERADKEKISDILWLCQDMREFELYGTVGAIVCCLDGINHLSGRGDIEKCFALAHNYLDFGGLFIFDVNTPYKFENFYGQNDYILEDDGIMCCWQNDYNKKSKNCDFYLTVFEENENGLWHRIDTVQREKCYSEKKLKSALTCAGFEICGFFGGFDFSLPQENCDRWYIVAKK